MSDLFGMLLFLTSKGLKIKTVYDIGAHDGSWSLHLKKHCLQNSKFVLFEANPIHKKNLKKTKFDYVSGIILSNEDKKTKDFFMSSSGFGDSYYKEKTIFYNDCETITLPCSTLDKLVKTKGFDLPDFIKLDTQGSELDILSGAKKTLKNASLVYCECPITKYNEGAPNIHEYLTFFANNDFVPIGISEISSIDNVIIHLNFLFIRKDVKNRILGSKEILL